MEILDYNTLSKTRYTDQHRFDAAFDAIVQTIVTQRMQRQVQYKELAETFLDIDKSKGKSLDLIGKIIGQKRELANFINRPFFGFEGARLAQEFDVGYWYSKNSGYQGELRVLSDEEYRRVIKARIVKNRTNNTRNDLLMVMNYLTGNNDTVATELNHGVIRLSITDDSGIAAYFLNKRSEKDSIIPIALGYRLITKYRTIERRKFSSLLYPLLFEEGINSDGFVDSGQLETVLETTETSESFESDVSVVSGYLSDGTLNRFNETFVSDADIVSGQFLNALVSLDVGFEAFDTDVSVVSGDLTNSLISITNEIETINTDTDVVSGILS